MNHKEELWVELIFLFFGSGFRDIVFLLSVKICGVMRSSGLFYKFLLHGVRGFEGFRGVKGSE